jgi:4-amino-4-deoxy-L-arabinose transferase-like glycosyltransferase
MKNIHRVAFSAALVMTCYLVLWFVWIRGEQLFFTAVIMAGAVWATGLIQRIGNTPPQAVPEGVFVPSALPGEKKAPKPWIALVFAAIGFAAAWYCYKGFMAEAWDQAFIGFCAGAVAWRFCMPFQLPAIPRPLAVTVLVLALLTGAVFRLYKAGEIPYGTAMVDETRLMNHSRMLMTGLRQSFAVAPGAIADGAIPFYFQALSMKVFGQSLRGFRMSGMLIGILIIYVLYRLGKEKESAWLGLAAALFWAMSLWPVTISRAQYLIVDTYLMVLVCMYLFVRAINKDSGMLFAAAGLFWGFSLNVYTAAQVVLALLPWFAFLVWILQPSRRGAIVRGWVPLLAGFLIGMAPLLLWSMTDPALAFRTYFGNLFSPHTAGVLGPPMGFFGTLEEVIHRGLYQFPKVVRLYTTVGVAANPWYFPPDYPAVQPAMFYLFLVGASICMARFRNPFYSFLLYWWLAGLLPAMVSDPSHLPNDRREMMSMPPMLIMSSVGLLGSVDLLTRIFGGTPRKILLALLGLGFFAWLAPVSWHDYFIRNQRDPALLKWQEAPTATFAKAVFDEDARSPVVVVASPLHEQSNWYSGHIDNAYNSVYWTLNPGLPTVYLDQDRAYLENLGLFGALRWGMSGPSQGRAVKDTPDVLVVLQPFHFYLEPLLHELGGVTVNEIPRIPSAEGARPDPNPEAVDEPLSMKLVRFHKLKAATLDAFPQDRLFEYTVEQLAIPDRLLGDIPSMQTWRADVPALVEDCQAHPRDWRVLQTTSFKLPDPWFWTGLGDLPGKIAPPFRLRGSFELAVPSEGSYCLGFSATVSTDLKVDGKSVCKYVSSAELEPNLKDGILGAPLQLSAGSHRLDVEQMSLSPMGNFQHTLRLVWKKPGGHMETLPLEVIRPIPAKGTKK